MNPYSIVPEYKIGTLGNQHSLKWDHRFLDLARHVSQWSKDPRTKVGAVLTKGKTEVVLGYNGLPSGIEDTDERLEDYDLKHKLVVHAERNAMDNAKRDLRGYTMYSTYPPCVRCTVDIINRGVARVVCLKSPRDKMTKHGADIQMTMELFREAGVIFLMYKVNF